MARLSSLVASGIVSSAVLDRMVKESSIITSAAIAGLLPLLREMEKVEAGAMEHIQRNRAGS